ncbi:MAG: hypothetical protein ABI670_16640 [Chloroflexota bacterium]
MARSEKWHVIVEDQRDYLGGLYEGDTLLYKYIPMPLAEQLAGDHNRAMAMEAALQEIAAMRGGQSPSMDIMAMKRIAERALASGGD